MKWLNDINFSLYNSSSLTDIIVNEESTSLVIVCRVIMLCEKFTQPEK